MTMETKREVIGDVLKHYLKASKEEKGVILNRLVETTKMHRGSIKRRFKVLQRRIEGYNWSDKRGRSLYYTPDVTEALRYIWDISHEICAERLHPIVGEYVRVLKRDRFWQFGDGITGKLLSMSEGTMKERVSHFDKVVSGGGRSMTKPSDLKEIIPVRRGPWQNPPPGFGEIDTVAHCGNSAEGLFAYTVQYTDISLTWCFLEAQGGKGKMETVESIENMEKRTPFRIKGLDPDSGGEFINWNLKSWCDRPHRKIELTRIRPGMKNDHGHIEQKNDKNVRKWTGYIRIDTETRLQALKELYGTLEIYINHFQPSMKCTEKIRKNVSHSSRKYDTPKTPYQRFMERPEINAEAKKNLASLHDALNPKILHDKLLQLRRKLFSGAKFTRSDI